MADNKQPAPDNSALLAAALDRQAAALEVQNTLTTSNSVPAVLRPFPLLGKARETHGPEDFKGQEAWPRFKVLETCCPVFDVFAADGERYGPRLEAGTVVPLPPGEVLDVLISSEQICRPEEERAILTRQAERKEAAAKRQRLLRELAGAERI
jgi:hypothetical protein